MAMRGKAMSTWCVVVGLSQMQLGCLNFHYLALHPQIGGHVNVTGHLTSLSILDQRKRLDENNLMTTK